MSNLDIITVEDNKPSRDAWLAARIKDITSTEVSALFGLSPYATEFELWHQKHDGVAAEFATNERMKWGTRLEPVIAAGVAEDEGYTIQRMNIYARDPVDRMGSSFDYEIMGHKNGPGIMEIKNVDWRVYNDQWIDGEEAPPHIELQVQHQLELLGYAWAVIVPLVGGNDPKPMIRRRDAAVGKAIRGKIKEFWVSVHEDKPPKPDFIKDADYIAKVLCATSDPGKLLKVEKPTDRMAVLIERYRVANENLDLAGKQRDAVKAEILMEIGDVEKVLSPFGSLSCSNTKPSLGTLITSEMVGTYVGGRDGFRRFQFYPKKQKK